MTDAAILNLKLQCVCVLYFLLAYMRVLCLSFPRTLHKKHESDAGENEFGCVADRGQHGSTLYHA